MHRCPKKQPFDSNIYSGSTQTCPHTFKSTHFQNYTQGTFKMRGLHYISQELMKVLNKVFMLIQGMSWTILMFCITKNYCFWAVLFFYYCNLLWCKTFWIIYGVLWYSLLIIGLFNRKWNFIQIQINNLMKFISQIELIKIVSLFITFNNSKVETISLQKHLELILDEHLSFNKRLESKIKKWYKI